MIDIFKAKEIGELLMSLNWSLSVAESCTGGLIAGAITEIAGSSRYFRGGIVAYDNRIKESVLEVPGDILSRYGAVSSQTVEAMARGACGLFNTDCAISVSGIAGPGGGTEQKPVGLVYIGVSVREKTRSFECRFSGNRTEIRESSVNSALNFLHKQLQSVT